MRKKRGKNISGQVWIETVIYTLIAFVMIGLVLSFAGPQIEKMQDRAILQQSTQMLKQIDLTIAGMGGAGNQRILEIGIKDGEFKLDCQNDKLIFELESKDEYTEPGRNVSDGSVIILTQPRTDYNIITLTRDFSSKYNLKFNGEDTEKIMPKASNSYRLSILNEGDDINGKILLNMSLS